MKTSTTTSDEINHHIHAKNLIEDYLTQLDWRVKENSNMAFSVQGLNNHIASTVSAHYWLNSIYDKKIREAHISAAMHIHDLQLIGSYCVGWDLKDILMRGFGGVTGKVESKQIGRASCRERVSSPV